MLLAGIHLDQVAGLLGTGENLRPLPLVQDLPLGLSWIKLALTAKRATVVAFPAVAFQSTAQWLVVLIRLPSL